MAGVAQSRAAARRAAQQARLVLLAAEGAKDQAIADLAGSEDIGVVHLAEALQYRPRVAQI